MQQFWNMVGVTLKIVYEHEPNDEHESNDEHKSNDEHESNDEPNDESNDEHEPNDEPVSSTPVAQSKFQFRDLCSANLEAPTRTVDSYESGCSSGEGCCLDQQEP